MRDISFGIESAHAGTSTKTEVVTQKGLDSPPHKHLWALVGIDIYPLRKADAGVT